MQRKLKKIKKKLPKTSMAFSSIINRKDRKDIDNKNAETNQRLKNYCRQRNINYIENTNISESSLRVKNLHLNRKDNSYFDK